MPSLLFVCLGNICRSPTAEAVFRSQARGLGWQADSAGTGDWHIGKPPYGPMQRAARAAGYDLSSLRARQLERGDFTRFDLILGMDASNLADIRRLAPPDTTARTALFLDYAPELGRDVPDPYFTRDFAGAVALIEAATARLVAALRAEG